MIEKTIMEYRGRELSLDKDLCDKYACLQMRPVNTADIDQYLLNETDKTGLDPFNIDSDLIARRFTVKEIENHVNDYLRIEIRLMGGKDFEIS